MGQAGEDCGEGEEGDQGRTRQVGAGQVRERDHLRAHLPTAGRGGVQAHEPPSQGAVLRPPQDWPRVRADGPQG